MIIARTRKDLNKTLQRFSQKPGKLALIPTMGNLHDGHLSLIRLAKLNAMKTIATIFVNPLQFGKNEDYSKYPRTEKIDIKKLTKEKCDILFIPIDKNEVFPENENLKKIESGNFVPEDLDLLENVTKQIEGHTICAFGEGSSWPVQGLLRHFKKEILQREKTARKKGTKFIFPLPKVEII